MENVHIHVLHSKDKTDPGLYGVLVLASKEVQIAWTEATVEFDEGRIKDNYLVEVLVKKTSDIITELAVLEASTKKQFPSLVKLDKSLFRVVMGDVYYYKAVQ